jgi:hypothetical protein
VSAEVAEAAEVEPSSSISTLVSSMLESCNTRSERARASLDLLIRTSGSRSGLLYALGPHGPVLSAQIGGLEPTLELETLVRDFLNMELTRAEATQQDSLFGTAAAGQTTEWKSARGDRVHPVLLCHAMDAGYAVTGLALLEVAGPFKSPGQLATELSRAALAADAIELVITP